MQSLALSLLSFQLFAGVAASQEAVDVPHLFGIASLSVKSDFIEVTKADTLPSGLELKKDWENVEKATIDVGGSFAVTDGHHVGYNFKLIAIQKGAAKLEMTPTMSLPAEIATGSRSLRHDRLPQHRGTLRIVVDAIGGHHALAALVHRAAVVSVLRRP